VIFLIIADFSTIYTFSFLLAFFLSCITLMGTCFLTVGAILYSNTRFFIFILLTFMIILIFLNGAGLLVLLFFTK